MLGDDNGQARQSGPGQASTPERIVPVRIDAFAHTLAITTRWEDMDVYGHVNNVVYYSYFDTAVNEYLVARGVLDPQTSPFIGLVVETRCTYFRSLTFPEPVLAALRVVRLGTSSVRYQIGLFQGAEATAAAQGEFVHVYVERATQRPAPIPAALREVLKALV